jgi:hypothetical protein
MTQSKACAMHNTVGNSLSYEDDNAEQSNFVGYDTQQAEGLSGKADKSDTASDEHTDCERRT